MTITINNIYGDTLFESNASTIKEALVEALKAGADLSGADLSGADLSGADLSGAYLSEAYLCGASLYLANLYGANLYGADLSEASLYLANLSEASLYRADLREANLSEADLPKFQITPKGYPMTGFKKLSDGSIATLLIPAEAARTASLVGRKCRAELAIVIEGSGKHGYTYAGVNYLTGETVRPDSYDGDIRLECAHGIHFFLTPDEAEEY